MGGLSIETINAGIEPLLKGSERYRELSPEARKTMLVGVSPAGDSDLRAR
jgi:hypothetical protein